MMMNVRMCGVFYPGVMSLFNDKSKTWNNLPAKVVESETIDTFKARLDEAWTNNPSKRSIDSLSTTNEDQEQFVEDLI